LEQIQSVKKRGKRDSKRADGQTCVKCKKVKKEKKRERRIRFVFLTKGKKTVSTFSSEERGL
jgi:hypothetical protein